MAHSQGRTDPVQVVQRAIELKKEAAEPDSGTTPFDQVWCVIDGQPADNIAAERKLAESKNIQLAVSTPCFEYWVLLHFESSAESLLDCEQVIHKLFHSHWPDYAKGRSKFDNVVKNAEQAARTAESLRRSGEWPEGQNPCSDVYRLINAVLKSKKRPTTP